MSEKINKYYKEYRQVNAERVKEYNKKYYHENKEKISEYSKKYFKEYYEKNKEKMKAKYREKNKQRNKEYYKKHKSAAGRPKTPTILIGDAEFKQCKICQEILPLESFYRESQNSDGRAGTCKQCDKLRRQRKLNIVFDSVAGDEELSMKEIIRLLLLTGSLVSKNIVDSFQESEDVNEKLVKEMEDNEHSKF